MKKENRIHEDNEYFCFYLNFIFESASVIEAQALARPPKTRPSNERLYVVDTESVKVGGVTEIRKSVKSRVVIVQGEPKTEYQVTVSKKSIPPRTWMIGAQGWYDFDGFNIDHLHSVTINDEVFPSPLSKFLVNINGKMTETKLEPGDVITKIDGFSICNLSQMHVAVQGAANPRKLEIEVVKNRDGETIKGTISAIKRQGSQ